MPAKQGNGRNKVDVKKLCVYALFTALCLVFGYIESLIPTAIIAPGIKLGLSNAVALLLVCKGDAKGAFAVNTARILLSALLFGSAVSLAFAVTAGAVSLCVTAVLHHFDIFSTVGVSVAGGVVHNIVQSAVAMLLTGVGVAVYIPLLLAGGAVSGAAVGIICEIILKKIKTK